MNLRNCRGNLQPRPHYAIAGWVRVDLPPTTTALCRYFEWCRNWATSGALCTRCRTRLERGTSPEQPRLRGFFDPVALALHLGFSPEVAYAYGAPMPTRGRQQDYSNARARSTSNWNRRNPDRVRERNRIKQAHLRAMGLPKARAREMREAVLKTLSKKARA